MMSADDSLPDDVETSRRLLRARDAELAQVRAQASSTEHAAALEGVKAQPSNIGAGRTAAGSVNALVVSYYRSPEFRGLKDSTQTVRRNIIERFRNERGDKRVARFGRAHIKDIIGSKAETPEAANNLLKVLRVLLNYAVDAGMIESNSAA
jgi:hypothetical protein